MLEFHSSENRTPCFLRFHWFPRQLHEYRWSLDASFAFTILKFLPWLFILLSLGNPKVYPPQVEGISKTMVKPLLPYEVRSLFYDSTFFLGVLLVVKLNWHYFCYSKQCRQAKISYSGKFTSEIYFQYDKGPVIREKVSLGHLPIMLKVGSCLFYGLFYKM